MKLTAKTTIVYAPGQVAKPGDTFELDDKKTVKDLIDQGLAEKAPLKDPDENATKAAAEQAEAERLAAEKAEADRLAAEQNK